MKEPHEIENYAEKAKWLKANGWTDLWHPDNWVRVEWFNHPTIDVDRAGCSTDSAYGDNNN
jgi:replicative superfamily II helicase